MSAFTKRFVVDGQASIVSPHCDDMAYSLGGSLLARSLGRHPRVVNVFSMSSYVGHSSFATSIAEVTQTRRKEEMAACRYVDAEAHFLELPEAPLRHAEWSLRDLFNAQHDVHNEPVFEVVESTLSQHIMRSPRDIWLFPLGVGDHIDHRLVNSVGIALYRKKQIVDIAFYEELPYAAFNDVDVALQRTANGYGQELIPIWLNTVTLPDKLRLLQCYPSQVRQQDISDVTSFHTQQSQERIWASRECRRLFV